MQRRLSCLMIALAALASARPAGAQEAAFKAAVAFSKFAASGTDLNVWDDGVTTTGFGGHVRFRLGPVALQPELHMVTRGASNSTTEAEDEQVRLEYLELPVLLVVPVRVGRFEPYAFGGGMVAVESRCRYVVREEGLKSNFGCDARAEVFERRKADYGVVAGGGISHPLGSGRIMLEARHTWGMRNIVSSPSTLELRNRTFMIGIGYTINVAASE